MAEPLAQLLAAQTGLYSSPEEKQYNLLHMLRDKRDVEIGFSSIEELAYVLGQIRQLFDQQMGNVGEA